MQEVPAYNESEDDCRSLTEIYATAMQLRKPVLKVVSQQFFGRVFVINDDGVVITNGIDGSESINPTLINSLLRDMGSDTINVPNVENMSQQDVPKVPQRTGKDATSSENVPNVPNDSLLSVIKRSIEYKLPKSLTPMTMSPPPHFFDEKGDLGIIGAFSAHILAQEDSEGGDRDPFGTFGMSQNVPNALQASSSDPPCSPPLPESAASRVNNSSRNAKRMFADDEVSMDSIAGLLEGGGGDEGILPNRSNPSNNNFFGEGELKHPLNTSTNLQSPSLDLLPSPSLPHQSPLPSPNHPLTNPHPHSSTSNPHPPNLPSNIDIDETLLSLWMSDNVWLNEFLPQMTPLERRDLLSKGDIYRLSVNQIVPQHCAITSNKCPKIDKFWDMRRQYLGELGDGEEIGSPNRRLTPNSTHHHQPTTHHLSSLKYPFRITPLCGDVEVEIASMKPHPLYNDVTLSFDYPRPYFDNTRSELDIHPPSYPSNPNFGTQKCPKRYPFGTFLNGVRNFEDSETEKLSSTVTVRRFADDKVAQSKRLSVGQRPHVKVEIEYKETKPGVWDSVLMLHCFDATYELTGTTTFSSSDIFTSSSQTNGNQKTDPEMANRAADAVIPALSSTASSVCNDETQKIISLPQMYGCGFRLHIIKDESYLRSAQCPLCISLSTTGSPNNSSVMSFTGQSSNSQRHQWSTLSSGNTHLQSHSHHKLTDGEVVDTTPSHHSKIPHTSPSLQWFVIYESTPAYCDQTDVANGLDSMWMGLSRFQTYPIRYGAKLRFGIPQTGAGQRLRKVVPTGPREDIPAHIVRVADPVTVVCTFDHHSSSLQGHRQTMEDEESILYDVDIIPSIPVTYASVIDGHGGRECARQVKFSVEQEWSKFGVKLENGVLTSPFFDSEWWREFHPSSNLSSPNKAHKAPNSSSNDPISTPRGGTTVPDRMSVENNSSNKETGLCNNNIENNSPSNQSQTISQKQQNRSFNGTGKDVVTSPNAPFSDIFTPLFFGSSVVFNVSRLFNWVLKKGDMTTKELQSGCVYVGALMFGDVLLCGNIGDSRAVLSECVAAQPVGFATTVPLEFYMTNNITTNPTTSNVPNNNVSNTNVPQMSHSNAIPVLAVAPHPNGRSILSVQLTTDHKPNNPLEQSRIEANGGTVRMGRINGRLAVSRAFGDAGYRFSSLVTATPDFTYVRLGSHNRHLLLCCDGVWDVWSNQSVVEFVADNDDKTSADLTEALCYQSVFKRGSKDNVSAVIFRL